MSPIDFMIGAFGVATLLLPGWLVARARSVPHPLLAGFIGSVVALFGVVLVLDALGASLMLGTVGGIWGILVVAAAAYGRSYRLPAVRPIPPEDFGWKENWPILLPLVPMLAVVAYRACAQPLFGVDTVFRWNFLAEQMLARRSLDFYPPVTAGDYEVYSWPDGIAPAVSSLYFWIYSIAGATRPALTAPLIILQFVLVLIAVHALARRMFSARAALFACALIACSPVIAWATTMGQETGLTAIALVALLFYLPRNRSEERIETVVVAAAAAGMGALAREYGLVLPILGFGLCIARRLSLRGCVVFIGVAVLCSAPWYFRNWIHTGNPVYNLAIGGVFPVNVVHSWLNDSFQVELGWSQLPPGAARLFVTNCCAALIGGVAGGLLYFRRAGTLLMASAVIAGLWVVSLGYTAAGFIYSLRVLSPALVLAAVLGGATLARCASGGGRQAAIILGLSLFSVDAALRTLALPTDVYRVPIAEWLNVGRAVHHYHERPVYGELVRVAGDERMLVLGPNALLTTLGGHTVPLWSPEVDFLFDASITPPEVVRRLRTLNIGFVLLNTGSINNRFLAHSAYFRDPAGTLQPLWSDNDMILLRVAGLASR